MKRIIILSLVFLAQLGWFGSMAVAQIDNSPFGVTLGSSLQTVKSVLDSKGVRYEIDKTNQRVTLYTEPIRYEDWTWDHLVILFSPDDRAFSMGFIKNVPAEERYKTEKATLALADKYMKRYPEYIDTKNPGEANAESRYMEFIFAHERILLVLNGKFYNTPNPQVVKLMFYEKPADGY